MDWDTRTYVKPVTRDGFFYDGRRFYVEIKNGSRMECVEREDSQRLYDLLTWSGPPPPLLTKKGAVAVRQPPPHKDPNVAFYCGQLVHYGLKQFKTKEPAKKHLLAAYGNNRHSLKIPEHILRIESDLKVEFMQADGAARRAYEEEKRKREAEAARQRSGQGARIERMFAQTRAAGVDDSDDVREASDTSDGDVVKVSKKDLKAAVKSMPETELRKMVGKLVDVSEVENAIRSYVVKNQGAKKRGSGKGKQAGTSKKRKVGADASDPVLDPIALQGKFNIIAPLISEEWGSGSDNYVLRLSPSTTHAHLWGCFNFGIISGIIRSTSSSTIPEEPFPPGHKVHFLWRGREQDGGTSFSDKNTGHIVFLEKGTIKGRLQWDGYDVKFSGKEDEDTSRKMIVWSMNVPAWKRVWRGYNADNYEKECQSRWGRWAGEAKPDPPANSDTSGHSDSEGYNNDAY
ncbi:hypothetical protein Moror_11956 [Moniliophthora roreri MCA 2997]|uniref:Uncharacterized protein n=1 Tax=Moniliophthora roreri (strain MCA 2997) TaxID=1381753 RepID=V2X3N4_MONRO|nr:hypothetical protein Moror_11956 [Moniliophthora roreri MCA 2997]